MFVRSLAFLFDQLEAISFSHRFSILLPNLAAHLKKLRVRSLSPQGYALRTCSEFKGFSHALCMICLKVETLRCLAFGHDHFRAGITLLRPSCPRVFFLNLEIAYACQP